MLHRVPIKKGDTKLMAVTLSKLSRFLKFLTGTFPKKFTIK